MEHKNNDRLLYNIFFIYDASFFEFLKNQKNLHHK
jgi:hypothetical protein